MFAASRILLVALALTGWVAADLPRKAPITKYTRLWTDSPFTSKPPPTEAGPAANPLGDYTLAGVSPVPGGYRVTLLNKKKPDERIIVEGDEETEGFKILEVIHKSGDPLATVVKMKSGSVTGTVAFDDKFLTLAPPPAAKTTPQGQPPGVRPGQQPQTGQPSVRQPRPRVVPPPARQQTQQAQPSSNRQRASRRASR